MGLTEVKWGKMGSSGVQRGQWIGFSESLGVEGFGKLWLKMGRGGERWKDEGRG